MHTSEPGHECRPVPHFELIEPRPVDETGNDLPDIVLLARVDRHDPQKLVRVVARVFHFCEVRNLSPRRGHGRQDGSRQMDRVVVVISQIVSHTGETGVGVGTSQFFRADVFAGRRFDERGTTKKNRPRALDDDGLVGHSRHICAPGRARPHDDRDLSDSTG